MTQKQNDHGSAAAPRIGLIVILASLAMLGPFTIDTIFPGFAAIQAQFVVDESAVAQITSVYLLSFAIMSLVHGPLSDALGRKPVMIAGLILYALASVGCALALNLPMLLAFRALQGFAAGSGQIISRAMVRDLYSGPVAQRLMSHVMMIFTIAPALAPVIGGWLLQVGRWPIIFWFLAAYGAGLAIVARTGLTETLPAPARRPLRLQSLLGGLLEVAGNPRFVRLSLAGALGFATQFLYIASAPSFIVRLLGKGELDFWILFVPMISGMLVGALLSAQLADRVSGPRLATLGFSATAIAGVLNCVVSALPGAPHLPWAVLAPGLMGFGNAVFFPVVSVALLDLFPAQRGSAASMQMFTQLLLNAAVAGVIVPLVTQSVLTLALCSLAFGLLGWLLWVWHDRQERSPLIA